VTTPGFLGIVVCLLLHGSTSRLIAFGLSWTRQIRFATMAQDSVAPHSPPEAPKRPKGMFCDRVSVNVIVDADRL
jgi:hypothetical protein